jgi:cadmium resistance protein CadD (predicted permease)
MTVLHWLRPIAAILLAVFGAVFFVLCAYDQRWLLALLGLVGFGAGVKLATLEEDTNDGAAY